MTGGRLKQETCKMSIKKRIQTIFILYSQKTHNMCWRDNLSRQSEVDIVQIYFL